MSVKENCFPTQSFGLFAGLIKVWTVTSGSVAKRSVVDFRKKSIDAKGMQKLLDGWKLDGRLWLFILGALLYLFSAQSDLIFWTLWLLPFLFLLVCSAPFTGIGKLPFRMKRQTSFLLLGGLLCLGIGAIAIYDLNLLTGPFFDFREVFRKRFVESGYFVNIVIALLLVLIFNFSWRNTFIFLLLFSLGFPRSEYLWLCLAMVLVFAFYRPRVQSSRPQLSWAELCFWASRLFIIMSWPVQYTDTTYYFDISDKLFKGQVPYIDFQFMYPPLSIFPMMLPRFLNGLFADVNFVIYRWIYMWLLFIGEYFFFHFLLRKKKEGSVSISGIWYYIVGGFFLGEFLYDRLDLILGFTFALMMYWSWKKKYFSSIFVGIFGIFFKLVTIITFPFVLMDLLQEKVSLKKKIIWLGSGALVFLLSAGAAYFFYEEHFLSFLQFHQVRGLQLESLWSSLDYFFCLFDLEKQTPFVVTFGAGSYNVLGAPSIYLQLGTWVPVLTMLLIYLKYWRMRKNSSAEYLAPRLSFAAILAFIIFGKVLSPQYLIWTLCLLPFCNYQWENLLDRVQISLFLGSLFLTEVVSYFYIPLIKSDLDVWTLLLIRNLALMVMVLVELLRGARTIKNKELADEILA